MIKNITIAVFPLVFICAVIVAWGQGVHRWVCCALLLGFGMAFTYAKLPGQVVKAVNAVPVPVPSPQPVPDPATCVLDANADGQLLFTWSDGYSGRSRNIMLETNVPILARDGSLEVALRVIRAQGYEAVCAASDVVDEYRHNQPESMCMVLDTRSSNNRKVLVERDRRFMVEANTALQDGA